MNQVPTVWDNEWGPQPAKRGGRKWKQYKSQLMSSRFQSKR